MANITHYSFEEDRHSVYAANALMNLGSRSFKIITHYDDGTTDYYYVNGTPDLSARQNAEQRVEYLNAQLNEIT